MYQDTSKLIEGLQEVARIVCSTMGPMGQKVGIPADPRNRILRNEFSRDGITVARNCQALFTGEDAWIKNMGAQVLVDAAKQTVDAAGDGTTTTCAITSSLLSEIVRALKTEPHKFFDGYSARLLKDLAEEAVDLIKAQSVQPTEEMLRNLCVVAANNNERLGEMVAGMIWELGGESFVHNTLAKGEKTRVEIKKGYELDTGLLIPQFLYAQQTPCVNVSSDRTMVVLRNPYVLLVEEKVTDFKEIESIYKAYQQAAKRGNYYDRPLLIVAGDFGDQALRFVISNLLEPRTNIPVPVFVVKSPRSGMQRFRMLEDIQAAVGTRKVFSKYSGTTLSSFRGVEDFGQCHVAELTKESARFMISEFQEDAVEKRVEHIRASEEDEQFKSERISKLTKGTGIVHIGGFTDAEHQYEMEVVEDTVRAAQSAMNDGVVPGAGYALSKAGSLLSKRWLNEELAYALYQAMRAPSRMIGENANLDQGEEVVDLAGGKILNLDTQEWEPIEKTKIIDSTRVCCEAVRNSVSLVAEIMTTKYVIQKVDVI